MANMLVIVMTIAVLVGGYQVSALGVGPCACYSLHLYTFATCSTPSLFTASNIGVTLHPNCTVVSTGCIGYGAFSSANVTATVSNAATTFTSTSNIDACNALTFIPSEYKALATLFGWDTACPVLAPKSVCGNSPMTDVNIALLPWFLEALDFASKLGVSNATITASHGGLSSSCIKIAAEVKKDPSCPAIPYPVVGFQNLPANSGISTSIPTVATLPGLTTATLPTVTPPACVPVG